MTQPDSTRGRHRILLAALLSAGLSAAAQAAPLDCTRGSILSTGRATAHEEQALRMLREEVEHRTATAWTMTSSAEAQGGCFVAAGTVAELSATLPDSLRASLPQPPGRDEAFALRTTSWQNRTVLLIAGHDERGVLFGIGLLLRKMNLAPGSATLAAPLNASMAPEKPVRSHQIGYRYKNNTYDAWTLAQFEQQIRDLAVFGANTVQLIAPNSDDAETSPLFPAPPLETLLGIDRILDRYGLNCDLYYPEMEGDYSHPEDVTRELARFEELVRQMPRLDALWIPGGDPGHTAPELLLPLVAQQAGILHRYHPGARVYLSAQGMDARQYEDFYRLLQQPPRWLSGVFFGPQSRDSFETQRGHLPAALPMIFYPDIGHTMHAQFPVPQWDPVFALTEGREPIDPRPADEGIIYRHFAPLHEGFVTYSEGANDDVNKMLWSQWGWSQAIPAQEILADYGRYFVAPRLEESFAKGLMQLEENWRGPLAANHSIEPTLQQFEAMAATPEAKNWRFLMAYYRATYDAYLQRRLRFEQAQQAQALEILRGAAQPSLAQRAALAEAQLGTPLPDDVRALEARLFQLGNELFHQAGLQLSTVFYGASNWERGANLDHADIPLNDRLWIDAQLEDLRTLPTAQQQPALAQLLAHYDPPAGTLYDDLGDPTREPHLIRGSEYAADPEMYHAAIDGVADRWPSARWNWAQLSYAEALYETPLALEYRQLDPHKRYRLRVVYSGEDYALPLRLVANGSIELQHATARHGNPETVDYILPAEATRSGNLRLEWFRPEGLGGGGRGRQIGEVSLTALP
jgi:hypothetical protein